jgi:hypothetical protein
VAACFGYVIYQVVNPNDLGSALVFWWLIGLTLGVSFPQIESESINTSWVMQPAHAGFLLQSLFLVTAVGAVYGFWLWAAN